MKKALFLDRDGVINEDYGYVHDKKNCQFIEGIFDLARLARKRNYIVFIVTNQAGIGRGYYTERVFHQFMEWMSAVFDRNGCKIQKVYFSPFHPEDGLGKYKRDHFSRKPNPGMLIEALGEFEVDPKSSVLIGDNLTDIQAGISAGIGKNLLLGNCDQPRQFKNFRYTEISSLAKAQKFLGSEFS